MSFQMSLWEVENEQLVSLSKKRLDSEKRLEDWIEKDSSLLGVDVLIIGRQVRTDYDGIIDLLAIDEEGNLVVAELKKDKTPREVVAQIVDYASWVNQLEPAKIDALAGEYLNGHLSDAFRERFDTALPESINNSHRLIIVASELDDSSERIVQYLSSEHSLDINVVFFTCFNMDGRQLVGRSWLMDPEQVEGRSEARRKVPWSGDWFVNVGEGPTRNWDDCKKYGFISAGQGERYSKALKKLKTGDKLFAYMKGNGYVGYGEVTAEAKMVRDFVVTDQQKPLLELPLTQPGMKNNFDDPELSEWVVGVKWLTAYSRDEAKTFTGAFANQNIVCKLRDEETLRFLRREFDVEK